MIRPEGFGPAALAPIIGGSQDTLLEIAVRESGCGLALLAEGSQAGLDRLVRGEVGLAAIHLHSTPDREDANLSVVSGQASLHDAVVVNFARREQGLLVAAGNPLWIDDLAGAVAKGARFAQRQSGAGAQLLLASLLAREGLAMQALAVGPGAFPTGQELALAIRMGRADCGIAARSIAVGFGLGFVPLVWEHVDLVLRRRSYFEPGPQALFAWMRGAAMAARAAELGGYELSGSGGVRLNR